MFFSKEYITDFREQPRVKERMPIRWHIPDTGLDGQAKIVNISASGMMIETKALKLPLVNCILGFQSSFRNRENFIPEVGRLVWAKKAGLGQNLYRLGVEFVSPVGEVGLRLRDRIHLKLSRWAVYQKLQNIAGVFLFLVAVVLMVFVLRQQNLIHQNVQQSHQLALSASTSQAQLYRQEKNRVAGLQQELSSTQLLLAETQTFLDKIRNENLNLEKQMQSVQASLNLGHEIVFLKQRNQQLTNELQDLQKQMSLFQGDVRDIAQGKAVLDFYRDRIKTAKKKIKALKIAAQKERDLISLKQGNWGNFIEGYSIRNGKPPQQLQASEKQQVNINVSFF